MTTKKRGVDRTPLMYKMQYSPQPILSQFLANSQANWTAFALPANALHSAEGWKDAAGHCHCKRSLANRETAFENLQQTHG